MPNPTVAVPPTPPVAAKYLGQQLSLMEGYVAHLSDTGVSHGLIGPREVPRLWERHVLNCAVVQELIPSNSSVIDIGSGAGLPGLVLAIARPDLHITLVEPLLRRVNWLSVVVEDLELSNVTVVRSRAEEQIGELRAQIVTSRAVAALEKLARWSLPLVDDGGRVLALKGSSAAEELAGLETNLAAWGVRDAAVIECGVGVVEPATIVTELVLDEFPADGTVARPKNKAKKGSKGGAHSNSTKRTRRAATRRGRTNGR